MSVETLLRKPPTEQPGKAFRAPWDGALTESQAKCAKDQNNPQAFCDAAGLRITLWCYGFDSREDSLPQARLELERALALDDKCANAHTLRSVLDLADWHWERAEAGFRLGVELEPQNAANHHWYALFLAAMGRHDEAMTYSKQSAALDGSAASLVGHGSIYYFAHRFEELAQIMERAVAEAPDLAPAYDWLGMAYLQLGRFEESIAVYRRAAELSDGLAEILAGLGHAYGVAGRRKEAEQILDYLVACAAHHYVPPVQIAFVAFSAGEDEQAYALLERAYREKSWELSFCREEPWLDYLHGDSRFQNLLGRIRFPPK